MASSSAAGLPWTVVDRAYMPLPLPDELVAPDLGPERAGCAASRSGGEAADGVRPGVGLRVREAVRAGEGGEPPVGRSGRELAGPRLGAEPVGVAPEHEHRDGDLGDDVLEGVVQV